MIPKIGSYIEHIEELDSTNSYASSYLSEKHPPEGTIILAKKQSKGRGQSTNKWESEGGKNLTFSVILYPTFISISQQFEISKAISLGVADFLSNYVDKVSIKWPNDIYVDKNKIAGILMEYSIQKNLISSCIIGIGLNINQGKFFSNAPNPVSLTQLTSKTYPLEECLSELLDKLNLRYQQLIDNDFVKIDKDYEQLLFQKDIIASYSAKGNVFKGKIIGVDEYGFLMIEDSDNQILKFDYKEVSFLL
jgi:BirA family transcriptional regulator, biotin operon repressor / biotin---[acetyl-CoA-carboxylase] ligase